MTNKGNLIYSPFIVVLIAIVLIDRIDFPSPNKKYEKVVPNENFKIVK